VVNHLVFRVTRAESKEISMNISNMIKNAAGRYLGRTGTGTTGRPVGGAAGRSGTPVPAGKAGEILRKLLNRR
jgi:hypothetical protein